MQHANSISPEVRQAYQAYAAGDTVSAERSLKEYLKQQPRDAQAHYLLGLSCAAQGKLQPARDSLAQAVAIAPDNASYHGVLGNLLSQMGERKAAIEAFKTGLLYAPNSAELYLALAGAYMAGADWHLAETALREAVRRRHEYPEAHYNLALVLSELDRLDEAEQAYRAAVELNPDFFQAWNNLGNLLLERGRVPDALTCYRELTQRVPDFAQGFCNLGMALERLGEVEPAEQAYRHALKLEPDLPDALEGLAMLCESLNRLDEARTLATRGLAMNRQWPGMKIVAAACARRNGDFDDALVLLENVDAIEGLNLNARLHHEKARCHEALGSYADAFENYRDAKRYQGLEAEREGVHAQVYLDKLTRLETFLASGAPLADAVSRLPEDDARVPLAFLVGFPRSGTTLLDQILDVHPKLLAVEEKPMLAAAEHALAASGHRYPADLPNLDAAQIETLRAAYHTCLKEYASPEAGQIVIDKFPLNAVEVPLIETLFPKARYVFALRHPCDVVFSCFSTLLKPNAAMANFHSLPDAARLYARVMDLWLEYIERYALDVHTVRYESLVEDFDGSIADVLKFLEVEWDDKVRDYREHALSRGQINTPSYEQVVKPIYNKSIGRWRNYSAAFEEVLPILLPYMERFGYEA